MLPALLAVAAVGCLLPTWSPVVTWAHWGEDGPELELAGRVLGVPHPTGYPLLMLLVRTVGLVLPPPISALNVVTLLAAVAAVMVTGLSGRRLAERAGHGGAIGDLAGMAAGLTFLTSLTWWRQATIGEVYPLHVLLLATVIWLLLRRSPRSDLLAAYVAGLGLAHHLQMLPALILLTAVMAWFDRERLRVRLLPALFAPLSLYAVLVLRSRQDPPLDWGNPETLAGLWWTVSGTPYRGNLGAGGFEAVLGRFFEHMAVGPPLQIGWPALVCAIAGGLVLLRRDRAGAALFAGLFLAAATVGAAYGIPDPAAYYLPAVWSLCVLAGVGAAFFWNRMPRPHSALRLVGPAAVLALFVAGWLVQTRLVAAQVDAADRAGFRYAQEGAQLPPRAIVISHGDGRTFSLWYGTGVLADRADVAVIYDNLLDWDWYRTQLARRHPDVDLPAPGIPQGLRHRFLAEMHVDHRPVYVTAVDPALNGDFGIEAEGALFRVHRSRGEGAIAGASSGTRDNLPDRFLRTGDGTPPFPR